MGDSNTLAVRRGGEGRGGERGRREGHIGERERKENGRMEEREGEGERDI